MSGDMDRSGGGSSGHSAGGGSGGGSETPKRKQLKSQKLDRTLRELEGAFADWEELSTQKASPEAIAAAEEKQRKAKAANLNEEEFRKKTKKLLNQLRQQLTELND